MEFSAIHLSMYLTQKTTTHSASFHTNYPCEQVVSIAQLRPSSLRWRDSLGPCSVGALESGNFGWGWGCGSGSVDGAAVVV